MDMDNHVLLEKLFASMPISVFYKDNQCRYQYLNRLSAEVLANVGKPDVLGKTDYDIMPTKQIADMLYNDDQKVLRTKEGSRYITEMPLDDGSIAYYDTFKEPVLGPDNEAVGVIVMTIDAQDMITRQKRLEQENIFDSMTSLYNKRMYTTVIDDMKETDNNDTFIALVDINYLKIINDIFGHAIGDKTIVTIAQVLKHVFRKDCQIFRIGGDEFVIIGHGWDKLRIEKAKTDMNNLGKKAFPYKIFCGYSFGYCLMDDTMSITDALKTADDSMYSMKKIMKDQLSDTMLELFYDNLIKTGMDDIERYNRMSYMADKLEGFFEMNQTDIENIKKIIKFQYIEKTSFADYSIEKDEGGNLTNEDIRLMLSFLMKSDIMVFSIMTINENWNGIGGNYYMARNEIPLYALIVRFLTICDSTRTIDASERKKYIQSLKGTILSPTVVNTLIDGILWFSS